MADKVVRTDIENAKYEYMKLRFRRVLGEQVNSHLVMNARKAVAKAVIARSEKKRGENA